MCCAGESSFCMKVSKCFLILTNLLVFVIGVALISAGVYLLLNEDMLIQYLKQMAGNEIMSKVDNIVNVPVVLKGVFMVITGLGIVLAVLSLAGMCGACCESTVLLSLYSVVLVIVIFVLLLVLFILEVRPDLMADRLEPMMYDSIKGIESLVTPIPGLTTDGTFEIPTNALLIAWTLLQLETKCCAVYNYLDYKNLKWNSTVHLASILTLAKVTLPTIPPGITVYPNGPTLGPYNTLPPGFGSFPVTLPLGITLPGGITIPPVFAANFIAAVPVSCCDHNLPLFTAPTGPKDFTDIIGCLTGNNIAAISTKGCYAIVLAHIMQFNLYIVALLGAATFILFLEMLSACGIICRCGASKPKLLERPNKPAFKATRAMSV